VKIVILVEGKTERAFKTHLLDYLETQLQGAMPKLDFHLYHGRIPTHDKLRRIVENNLKGKNPADYVIALTDVYTGTTPHVFKDAADAKEKMRAWVGAETRFYPHAAQYDFEAWLLPYWSTIQKLAGHNKTAPGSAPEAVNHDRPPSRHIGEIFSIGKCRDSYIKPRDAKRILKENDLSVAINKCPELKLFINTIITLCKGTAIPQ
jgi:hypothetical protein